MLSNFLRNRWSKLRFLFSDLHCNCIRLCKTHIMPFMSAMPFSSFPFGQNSITYKWIASLFFRRLLQKKSFLSKSNSNLTVYIMTHGCSTGIMFAIPGGPIKTEQSIQSIFQDFALINSYLFPPCWIEHLFLITITPRSSNLVENFLFYE